MNKLLDYNKKKDLKLCSEQYMIGILSWEYNVLLMKNSDNIMFYLMPLCDEPVPIIDNYSIFMYEGSDHYIGIDDDQFEDMLPDFYYHEKVYAKRIEMIENKFGNNLVLFKPIVNFNERTPGRTIGYKNAVVMRILEKEVEENQFYRLIPRINTDPEKFEEMLSNGTYFELQGYNADLVTSLDILICGDYLYYYPEFTKKGFSAHEVNKVRWKAEHPEAIRRYEISKLSKDYDSYFERANENLIFIDKRFLGLVPKSKDYKLLKDIDYSVQNTPIEKIDVSEDVQSAPVVDKGENSFIHSLRNLTAKKGLSYKLKDLVNLHTSIKTNPLTIIAGMSGTGKTQLALNYAKMLDLAEDNKTLLFMPISPSFTEPSDVLGYLNNLTNTYVPSETGLVKFLKNAMESPNQMHMVIFDEMNLAQVEYWFSPFISILEKETPERILYLYDDDAECENSSLFPNKISISENVIFVGTVNLDETTKDFSDRLLDRTFVVKLYKDSFINYFSVFKNEKQQVFEQDSIDVNKCRSYSQFMNWKTEKRFIDAFSELEMQFIDELDNIIRNYDHKKGISYRVLRNVGNYLNNIPTHLSESMISKHDAFDLIINQTIVPKLKGTDAQLKDLIGIYDSEKNTIIGSRLYELLKKYNQISSFDLVVESIKNISEDLRVNGYAG
jgi:hypothetical protein